MPSIANLVEDRAEAVISIGGGELHVAYRPKRVTMAEDARRQRLADDGDSFALAKAMERLLISWDLDGPIIEESDDGLEITRVSAGESVPLDPEVMQFIPLPILVAIMQGVQLDAMPDPGKRRGKR